MEYVTLNNGVQMPVLGLGTFRATGGDCARSVRAAIAAGYRLIDTAEAYGNEEEVGRGIREGGVSRSELFLTTKVNFRSYERARETVEASLRKLGTDYLDLVLLHWPFGHYYAAWEALEALCEAGTIRAIGVSNFDADRLVDLVSFHRVTPAVDQIETHLFCQRRGERPWLEKYGVHHMAYAPLGRDRAGEMFALQVRGESMIGAGILDGDVVLVRRQNTALSGQIGRLSGVSAKTQYSHVITPAD